MKKLSAYTIASNCTDLTDCCDGLIEIFEAIKERRRAGKRVFVYQGERLRKLRIKLVKFVRTQSSFDEYELAKLEKVDSFYYSAHSKLSEIAINKNRKIYGIESFGKIDCPKLARVLASSML